MDDSERTQRLLQELDLLRDLAEDSNIFEFEPIGEPPTKYVATFRGTGLNRSLSSGSEVEKVELHRCEIRIPYAFPERPPDIRWLTPICHPNISFSGLVKLRDVGLPWEADLGLDIICERLWDMARLAYYDEERATNYAARNWLSEQDEVKLPLDHRPLRDKTMPTSSNVVKYERKAKSERPTVREKKPKDPKKKDDVFFIGDETPTPSVPRRRGDDDVMYIGYE